MNFKTLQEFSGLLYYLVAGGLGLVILIIVIVIVSCLDSIILNLFDRFGQIKTIRYLKLKIKKIFKK